MNKAQVCAILERLDSSTSINIFLQNEFNEVSILHAAITLQNESRHRIVQALIKAGVDCDRRDESGLTACECALTVLGDRELAAEMIATELENQPDDRAFYVMVRRGSLAVFKLFLELRKFEERQMFELMANAMIELNVKRVVVEDTLQAFLQYHLAEYAFRNLSGDKKSSKDVNEWRMHFKVIAANWKTLWERYNDRDFANMDNEFLYRIETIHNHLFFIKDKRFVRHLPIMETVFCLGIFITIFKWHSEFEIFKLIINKLNIMQFLDVVCRQLGKAEVCLNEFAEQLKDMLDQVSRQNGMPSKEHLINYWTNANPSIKLGENIVNKVISGCKKKLSNLAIVDEIIANENFELPIKINHRDRSTLARLGRCYFRTKQLYSIHKCIFHQQALSSYANKTRNNLITVPAVKRIIQVIGEAIKSTKNSPNIPKKVGAILTQMLTNVFPTTNKYFREFYSHKYSLAKRFLFEPAEALYYNTIASRLGHVEMIFSLVFVSSVLEASRSLLGSMRRCQSVGQLKSLIQFVGDLKMAELSQKQQFEKVEAMFKKMSETISNSKFSTEGERLKVNSLKKGLQMKEVVLTRLRDALICKWVISFEDIKYAVLGGAELTTIHRMIEWNLSFLRQTEIYDSIQTHWLANHVIVGFLEISNTDLISHNPSVMGGVLATMENKLRLIEEEEYPENTWKILKSLEVTDPSQELVEILHKQLLKYYENIFFLDNKYKAIKQLFKTRKLRLDEECFKRMRMQDEQSLQKVFDDRVNDMRKMLNANGVFTVDDLVAKFHQIPTHVIQALEYCQLELNEMLITVGYFGDNFHLLKHRIPLIHGRNYRNYLAHDTLSYNVLTDSTRIKVIVNAFVMMKCSVNLFGRNGISADEDYTFPNSEDTLKWSKNQERLASSIRRMNCDEIRECIDAGGDLSGVFCKSIGFFKPFNFEVTSLELVDPNLSDDVVLNVMRLFEGIFPKSTEKISSPPYRSLHASHSGDFDRSYRIFSKHQPVRNLALPQQFFYWKDLVNHLPSECLKANEKDEHGRTILHRLSMTGNYFGVEKVLELNPEVNLNALDTNGSSPLDFAIRYGFVKIAKLLISKSPQISHGNQQFAVINHLNDFLPQLFVEFDEILLLNEIYIMTAVRVDNCVALKFIIDHLYRGSHGWLKNKHLPTSLSLAGYLDRFRIVQFLLSIPNVEYFSDEAVSSGNSALQHAIHRRNWSAVQLLLKHGASPNWINHEIYQPLKTAFQLAVEANSCRVLRMMTHVNQRLYRTLKHPLSIAIMNDSTKMSRYLQKMGFTMLDSDSILQISVKYGNKRFINEIFQALDAFIDTCKSSDGMLEMIVHLLSRWKVIAYLEKPGCNSITAVLQAVITESWELLSVLMQKSKDVRKVDERFICSVEFCSKQGPLCTFGAEDVGLSSKLAEYCDTLLKRLKKYIENSESSSRINLPIGSNLEGLQFDCYLARLGDGMAIDLGSLSTTPINLQDVFKSMMQLLHDSEDLVFGTVQETSTSPGSYFVLLSDMSCLFRLSSAEPPQSLNVLVNSGDPDGETPLHEVAMQRGDLEPMKLLLANGANPLATNSVGQTPLHLSLTGPSSPKAMFLLNHCIEHDLMSLDGTSALELSNGQGFRPIHIAAMLGKLDAVQLLVDRGVDVRALDSLGWHAAIYALCTGYLKVVRILLEHDPELVKIAGDREQTLLHHSTRRHEENAILLLLEYDVDITVRDREGTSAIQLAIEYGYAPWVKIVLFYARINQIHGLMDHFTEPGIPALVLSVFHNKAELLQAVVEYEIDSELSADLSGESLRKLCKVLTGSTSNEGYTAFHIAARFGFVESAEFVLHCQARYNELSEQKLNLAQDAVDLQGNTPLDYALEMQNELLVNMLLSSQ